jgi:hypothetical protein
MAIVPVAGRGDLALNKSCSSLTSIFKRGIISYMKRLLILILISIGLCSVALAQSPEDKRRVEEEKRQDLKLSEFYLPEAEPVKVQEDRSDQNSYFEELMTKEVAVLSDVYKTLTILMGAGDQFSDLDSQYDFLVKNGIVSEVIGTKANYDEPLRKGATAYMFTKAIDIKGGIILRAFGTTQRYAFKELVYREIMFPGNVHDVMTGQELILTVTRAADHMANKQKDPQ